MSAAPRLSLVEAGLHERDVALRLPFRFGVVTMTEATQAFVRVRIRLEDGREGWGVAAELLAPKWFDKDPALSNDDNLWQLRDSLGAALHFYAAAGPTTAFGLWRDSYDDCMAAGAAADRNPLVAGFGPALLDKAVLDALCRIEGVSVFEAMAGNLAGVEASALTPDLAGFDVDAFVRSLRPAASIAVRHTVGLVDALTGPGAVGDGLPETLEQAVEAYGLRYFKIKLGGEADADLARLAEVAAVLNRIGAEYRVTLDGNEQYADAAALEELMRRVAGSPALARLNDAILFVEQPFPRDVTPPADGARLALGKPLLLDEGDGAIDAFPRARLQGYAGVSSKSCKGLYKSLINAARCAFWNREGATTRYFMSAEDLMTQAGPALQQDLALASLIGCEHAERNGHHYVRTFAGAPAAERRAFVAAHPDLYREADGGARPAVENGRLALGSLARPGFACAATPDFGAMRAMPERE